PRPWVQGRCRLRCTPCTDALGAGYVASHVARVRIGPWIIVAQRLGELHIVAVGVFAALTEVLGVEARGLRRSWIGRCVAARRADGGMPLTRPGLRGGGCGESGSRSTCPDAD